MQIEDEIVKVCNNDIHRDDNTFRVVMPLYSQIIISEQISIYLLIVLS